MSGCAIAAIIVGVLIGLVAVVAGVGGYMVYKQAGGKAGVIKSAFAIANPDYDILDVDEREKTITVRHKKTGKTATIPISSLKDGRIDPAELGMTEKEAQGTGGAPEWVKYPDAKQMTAAQILGITTLVYETDDPVEKVMEYYKTEIGNKGIHATNSGSVAIVVDDANGSLQISAHNQGRKTMISIVFRKK